MAATGLHGGNSQAHEAECLRELARREAAKKQEVVEDYLLSQIGAARALSAGSGGPSGGGSGGSSGATAQPPPAPLQAFYCSISGDIMADPVMTDADNTYDRAHITRWLSHHNTDPLTGVRVGKRTMADNLPCNRSCFGKCNGLHATPSCCCPVVHAHMQHKYW